MLDRCGKVIQFLHPRFIGAGKFLGDHVAHVSLAVCDNGDTAHRHQPAETFPFTFVSVTLHELDRDLRLQVTVGVDALTGEEAVDGDRSLPIRLGEAQDAIMLGRPRVQLLGPRLLILSARPFRGLITNHGMGRLILGLIFGQNFEVRSSSPIELAGGVEESLANRRQRRESLRVDGLDPQ